ncbi:hypothetical protein D3C79_581890 [compost metagenome]
MAADQAFDIQGRDPFSTRLDQVLEPIMDMNQPIGIDAGDVPCVQPTTLPQLLAAVRVLEITSRKPRTAYQQLPDLMTILRQCLMRFIHQLHLHQRRNHSRTAAPVQLLFFVVRGKVSRQTGQRNDRAGFRHTVRPPHVDVHGQGLARKAGRQRRTTHQHMPAG